MRRVLGSPLPCNVHSTVRLEKSTLSSNPNFRHKQPKKSLCRFWKNKARHGVKGDNARDETGRQRNEKPVYEISERRNKKRHNEHDSRYFDPISQDAIPEIRE